MIDAFIILMDLQTFLYITVSLILTLLFCDNLYDDKYTIFLNFRIFLLWLIGSHITNCNATETTDNILKFISHHGILKIIINSDNETKRKNSCHFRNLI